jgi:hypothetical protein
MDCRLVRSVWALLLLVVAGCSGGGSATAPATNASEPAAQAAYDFLDAVLKGDTQRASNCLTPTAIQRIAASGKQFAPPGLDTASFRIGEVRLPSPTHAIVQCFLSDTPSGAEARSEEIACLLTLVDNEWRVSGIAYSPGPNRPPVILNFEKQQGAPVTQQATVQAPADSSRPSPRTAQEAVPAAAYR